MCFFRFRYIISGADSFIIYYVPSFGTFSIDLNWHTTAPDLFLVKCTGTFTFYGTPLLVQTITIFWYTSRAPLIQ